MSPSTFTWLDHRSEDAQRVREALAAFDDQGMIDPLGFGVVRDAFSEMLFPGTSTVQNGARYFVFVPWVYQRLDREQIAPVAGAQRARELEVELIEALLRGSTEHDGIIGRYSRATTKQLPSAIYWGGLRRWGIRRFTGSRTDYVATLTERRKLVTQQRDDDHRLGLSAWQVDLPPEKPGTFEESTLDLPLDEAEYLQNRILNAAPETYLALLVRDGDSTQEAEWPWSHPLAAAAPHRIRTQLEHAELFSTVSWGAGLLYNRELSRMLEEDGGEPIGDFDAILDQWLEQMAALEPAFRHWDRAELWALVETETPVVSFVVRSFIDRWLDLAIASPKNAINDPESVALLRGREAQLKGPRAKLANRRAREISPSAQGDRQLQYRWPQVSRIVTDILWGLEGA